MSSGVGTARAKENGVGYLLSCSKIHQLSIFAMAFQPHHQPMPTITTSFPLNDLLTRLVPEGFAKAIWKYYKYDDGDPVALSTSLCNSYIIGRPHSQSYAQGLVTFFNHSIYRKVCRWSVAWQFPVPGVPQSCSNYRGEERGKNSTLCFIFSQSLR